MADEANKSEGTKRKPPARPRKALPALPTVESVTRKMDHPKPKVAKAKPEPAKSVAKAAKPKAKSRPRQQTKIARTTAETRAPRKAPAAPPQPPVIAETEPVLDVDLGMLRLAEMRTAATQEIRALTARKEEIAVLLAGELVHRANSLIARLQLAGPAQLAVTEKLARRLARFRLLSEPTAADVVELFERLEKAARKLGAN